MAMFNLNHPDVVSKPQYLIASDVYYEAEPYFAKHGISVIHIDDPTYVDMDYAVPEQYSPENRKLLFERLPHDYRIGYSSVVPFWSDGDPYTIKTIIDQAVARLATPRPSSADDDIAIEV